MFCKVMTIDKADGHRETVYQCDRVTCNRDRDDSGDFTLHILKYEGQGGVEIEFQYKDYDIVQIFLMNDDGQTIDRHGWRK